MSLEIQKLKKEGINDLKVLFENTPFLAEHNPFITGSDIEFEWQFFSEDYEECLYYIARDDNELIGTLAALIIPMRTPEGDVCYTIKPEDALINVKGLLKHNRRDVFKELQNKIDEETQSKDIKFLWGFSESVDAFKRLGFESCFRSQQGIYSYKPLSIYRHFLKLKPNKRFMQKASLYMLSIASYLKMLTFKRSSECYRCTDVELDEINEQAILSFLPNSLYCLYLNKSLINWRLIRNPSKLEYGVLQFENANNEIISYLIYSRKYDDAFFIEQFLFDDKLSFQEKRKIIGVSLKYLKRKNASIVQMMGFNHNTINSEEIGLFKRSGFIFVKNGMAFILKSNYKEIRCEDIYLSRLNMQGIE